MSRFLLLDRLHWRMRRAFVDGAFRVLLPVAARLPMRLGILVADLLGLCCYLLDLDWRSVALREHYVRRRTRLAFEEICRTEPLSTAAVERAVKGRFINAAREELEGHWFRLRRAEACHCEFAGLDAVAAHMATGQGLVLLTLHFDASLMGVVQMGLAGLKLNLMTSNIVEDARVPCSVQRYFKQKYEGINAYLNGGRSWHAETHLKAFYSGLRRGEAAVVLGEAPSVRTDEALDVLFLGRRRAFAPGAVRIAEKMNCPMAAFVCLRLAAGRYRVICTPIHLPSATKGHAENVQSLFGFLDAQVRANPEAWWAADQLPNFINLDDRPGRFGA